MENLKIILIVMGVVSILTAIISLYCMVNFNKILSFQEYVFYSIGLSIGTFGFVFSIYRFKKDYL